MIADTETEAIESGARINVRKAPFPWFGGKSDAAPAVWAAIGDVGHYVEPFAGSLAVLLRRPHPCNRTYHSETVNDLDGLLCNAWRAIIADPVAVAEACSWPVIEADLHARHLALLEWRRDGGAERLMGSPDYYDARMAGWWLWGQSAWIGSGWCSGRGPWVVGADGRIEKRPRAAEGVSRSRPHVSNSGHGVIRPQLREEGVGEYHPMTMPELVRWMRFLSARLRHVRVINGSWDRCVTSGVLKTITVRSKKGPAGVFLDPPYLEEVRASDLYAHDSGDVAHAVRAWCLENGGDPDLRIVLAGFDGEHNDLEAHGWTAVEWFRAGFLKGGMGQQSQDRDNETGVAHSQHRERLWLSPHCAKPETERPRQRSLWEAE